MEKLPDCEKCDNDRVVPDGDGGYQECECLVKFKLRRYLSPIGEFDVPPDSAMESVESKVQQLDQNLFINTPGSFSILQFNGVIAYLLKQWFPEPFELENIFVLWTEMMEDDYSFGRIFEMDKELAVLTGGLPEEHFGPETNTGQDEAAKQIISSRIRNGLPTWYVAKNNPYPVIEKVARNNDFQFVDLTSGSNNASSEDGIVTV